MKKTSIIIVDDHPIFRTGVIKVINDLTGFEVIAEAENKDKLYKLLKNKSCDILIIDIKMREQIEGIEILKKVKSEWPKIKILILSQYYKQNYIELAVKHDADGYITKDDVYDTIKNALYKIVKGEKAFSQKIKSFMFDNIMINGSFIDKLTPKEKKVLSLIVQRKKRQEIADELGVALTTVDFHKSNIKTKLGADTDLDLFAIAEEYGLI